MSYLPDEWRAGKPREHCYRKNYTRVYVVSNVSNLIVAHICGTARESLRLTYDNNTAIAGLRDRDRGQYTPGFCRPLHPGCTPGVTRPQP